MQNEQVVPRIFYMILLDDYQKEKLSHEFKALGEVTKESLQDQLFQVFDSQIKLNKKQIVDDIHFFLQKEKCIDTRFFKVSSRRH